jgi:hypothetical protein
MRVVENERGKKWNLKHKEVEKGKYCRKDDSTSLRGKLDERNNENVKNHRSA